MAAGYLAFIKELKTSFNDIGAFIPSSPALGRAMVRPIREAKKERLSILEVGPGTGPFTRQILKLMRPQDSLLVCEINSRFVAQLKRELPKFPAYRKHQERVEIFEGPIQDLARKLDGAKFDVIVSSLPLSNFPPEMVLEVLQLMNDMLVEDGVMTFCEYVGIRQFAQLFPEHRKRAKEVEKVVRSWCRSAKSHGALRRELSLFNLPPAFTFSCRRNGTHRLNGTNGTGRHA